MQVPDEDASVIDISGLFTRILERVYDPLETFVPLEGDRDAPIRAEIESSQSGSDFQGIPITICDANAVSLFGLYIKVYILHKDEGASTSSSTLLRRNAFEVIFVLLGWGISRAICVDAGIDACMP